MNLLLYLLDTHGSESKLRSFLSGFCDNNHQIIVVCESRQDVQLLNNIDNCKEESNPNQEDSDKD